LILDPRGLHFRSILLRRLRGMGRNGLSFNAHAHGQQRPSFCQQPRHEATAIAIVRTCGSLAHLAIRKRALQSRSPPGQMLGGSSTGSTTRGRVGLDHHNLASQSVFEPPFDLTSASTSIQQPLCPETPLVTQSRSDSRPFRVAFLYSGFTRRFSIFPILSHGQSLCLDVAHV
jgi:hypothetical protein